MSMRGHRGPSHSDTPGGIHDPDQDELGTEGVHAAGIQESLVQWGCEALPGTEVPARAHGASSPSGPVQAPPGSRPRAVALLLGWPGRSPLLLSHQDLWPSSAWGCSSRAQCLSRGGNVPLAPLGSWGSTWPEARPAAWAGASPWPPRRLLPYPPAAGLPSTITAEGSVHGEMLADGGRDVLSLNTSRTMAPTPGMVWEDGLRAGGLSEPTV